MVELNKEEKEILEVIRKMNETAMCFTKIAKLYEDVLEKMKAGEDFTEEDEDMLNVKLIRIVKKIKEIENGF